VGETLISHCQGSEVAIAHVRGGGYDGWEGLRNNENNIMDVCSLGPEYFPSSSLGCRSKSEGKSLNSRGVIIPANKIEVFAEIWVPHWQEGAKLKGHGGISSNIVRGRKEVSASGIYPRHASLPRGQPPTFF